MPPIDAMPLSHEDHLGKLDPKAASSSTATGRSAPSTGRRTCGRAGRGRAEAVRDGPRDHRRQGVPHHQHPLQAFSDRPAERYTHFRRHLYIDELEQIQDGVHVTATIIDLGNATFELGVGAFQINMDGKQAVRLLQDILEYSLALMQFESWTYVKKHGADWAGCSRRQGSA
ncbi:uncharacterized protein BO72DRAFT_496106 [Aspergillus fijiensis CBS 313.89]|uniref:Uncharacterized protein n=1 Tax=Aspergillus fijiensis CBS 313.89 TaxID=1448319 RepID=A0A8G1RQH8_9EURO|nr:uncharacterized protein BO72DRAFT_496106 [Aspergillus fijiensis CBS 313.89]RAK77439.1 hypothetical protein BO72DRAFT_496106 [Aspergillus fijiensis CBS 313.89]